VSPAASYPIGYGPASGLSASGANPAASPSIQPGGGPMSGTSPAGSYDEPGPPGDLTTVYRRDGAPPPMPAPVSERPGSKLGMVLGVIVFAVVGFAVAALAIQFLQGR
jgi:hypothetical protein